MRTTYKLLTGFVSVGISITYTLLTVIEFSGTDFFNFQKLVPARKIRVFFCY